MSLQKLSRFVPRCISLSLASSNGAQKLAASSPGLASVLSRVKSPNDCSKVDYLSGFHASARRSFTAAMQGLGRPADAFSSPLSQGNILLSSTSTAARDARAISGNQLGRPVLQTNSSFLLPGNSRGSTVPLPHASPAKGTPVPGLQALARAEETFIPARALASGGRREIFPREAPKPVEGSSGGGGGHGPEPSMSIRVEGKGILAVPLVPLALGFAGAIPFVALAPPLPEVLPLPDILAASPAAAQAAYAACILSFLGGPHWGLAMAARVGSASVSQNIASVSVSTARYIWSVTPSLLAWFALLLPPLQAFAILIPSFLLAFLVDLGYSRLSLLPSWYLPLRLWLTSIAVMSMGATFLGLSLGSKPKESSFVETV